MSFRKYMNLCRTEINMRKLINGSLLDSKVTTELSNHQLTPVIVNIFTCTSYCMGTKFHGVKILHFFLDIFIIKFSKVLIFADLLWV